MKAHSVLVALSAAAAGASLYAISNAQARDPQQATTVLRAERIELVDARGVERARLSTEPGGEVVLRLMGANGEIRVKLGASNDGSGLLLATGTTEPGVHALAQRTRTTLKLKSADRERVIEP